MYISIALLSSFAAICCHEIGHWMSARLLGMKVIGVTVGLGPELMGYTDKAGTRWGIALWPVAGKCTFTNGTPREPTLAPSFKSKVVIYLAGSGLNLAVAGLCLVIVFWSGDHSWPGGRPVTLTTDLIESTLVLLAIVSVCCGLFNLLPIPPLDGGQILLVVVERAHGKPLSGAAINSFRHGALFFTLLCTGAIVMWAC